MKKCDFSHLRKKGYDVVLVTSGAIGAGIGELHLAERPRLEIGTPGVDDLRQFVEVR